MNESRMLALVIDGGDTNEQQKGTPAGRTLLLWLKKHELEAFLTFQR